MKPKKKPGRAKVLPPGLIRRAYFVAPEVARQLDILAAERQVPVSVVANEALAGFVKRKRGA